MCKQLKEIKKNTVYKQGYVIFFCESKSLKKMFLLPSSNYKTDLNADISPVHSAS